MKCEVCSASPATDSSVALFRQNPKGEIGIWRCQHCNNAPVAQEVGEITALILDANRAAKGSAAGASGGESIPSPTVENQAAKVNER